MPSIPLHPPPSHRSRAENPLPRLLHTPTGLALLELQGTIHFPPPTPDFASTQVGKLVFPLYSPEINGVEDTEWMKRVYLYVGKNQRMAGEVKKLVRPFAVVGKRGGGGGEDVEMGGVGEGGKGQEELEIVEVVKWRIVFSSRPEPVGGGVEEEDGCEG